MPVRSFSMSDEWMKKYWKRFMKGKKSVSVAIRLLIEKEVKQGKGK